MTSAAEFVPRSEAISDTTTPQGRVISWPPRPSLAFQIVRGIFTIVYLAVLAIAGLIILQGIPTLLHDVANIVPLAFFLAGFLYWLLFAWPYLHPIRPESVTLTERELLYDHGGLPRMMMGMGPIMFCFSG